MFIFSRIICQARSSVVNVCTCLSIIDLQNNFCPLQRVDPVKVESSICTEFGYYNFCSLVTTKLEYFLMFTPHSLYILALVSSLYEINNLYTNL